MAEETNIETLVGKRPKLDLYDPDKPLTTRLLINLKNYDSLNLISSVAVDAGSIAVGTQSGKILLFDTKSMELKEPYMAHTRKVTDIWMQHNKAIVSTSHDMKIRIKSLTSEFDDQTIDIEGYAEEL